MAGEAEQRPPVQHHAAADAGRDGEKYHVLLFAGAVAVFAPGGGLCVIGGERRNAEQFCELAYQRIGAGDAERLGIERGPLAVADEAGRCSGDAAVAPLPIFRLAGDRCEPGIRAERAAGRDRCLGGDLIALDEAGEDLGPADIDGEHRLGGLPLRFRRECGLEPGCRVLGAGQGGADDDAEGAAPQRFGRLFRAMDAALGDDVRRQPSQGRDQFEIGGRRLGAARIAR